MVGIHGAHGDGVVIHVRTVDLMQMSVVKVVGVAVMLDVAVAAMSRIAQRIRTLHRADFYLKLGIAEPPETW